MAKKNYGYGGKGVAVMEWLNTEPNATDAHIAKHVGCHPTYVKQIRRKMVHAQQEEKSTEELLLDTLHKVSQGKGKPKPGEYIEVEGQLAPNEIDAILDQRASNYGSFMQSSDTAVKIKGIIHNALVRNETHMFPDQMIALDMIAMKISRIVNGNAAHVDSWVDIAGYAKLVADRLQGTVR